MKLLLLSSSFQPLSWVRMYRAVNALQPGQDKVFKEFLLEFLDWLVKLLDNHGPVTTIKIWKDLNSRAKLIVVHQKVDRQPYGGKWIKTNRLGLPSALPVTTKLLEVGGTSNGALTIIGLVNLARTKPDTNLDTITGAFTGTWGGKSKADYLTDWQRQVEKVIRPWKGTIEWSGTHVSLKAGPMHQSAMLSSGLEAVTFAMTGMMSWFQLSCQQVGAADLYGMLESFQGFIARGVAQVKFGKVISLAKLAFLADKAGKTRVVYVLNWWVQDLLLPLHLTMMEWLKAQPQDGTFDQTRAVEVVKSWTLQGIPVWSFDLTAATDRWPKCHQKVVIERFAGKTWSSIWDTALGITPYSAPHGAQVSYSVGQPMGAYASWAALAMTHHVLLRTLANKVGADQTAYLVLGDDVVIADRALAKAYLEEVQSLGIQISLGKSLTPDKQLIGFAAEFAKQVVWNGENRTALSADLLKQVFLDYQWWNFPLLVHEYCTKTGRWFYRTSDGLWIPTPIAKWLELLPNSSRHKALVLVSNPFQERCLISEVKALPNGMYVQVPDPWAGVSELTYLTYKLGWVEDQFQEKLQALIRLKSFLEGNPGIMGSGYGLGLPSHPIKAVVNDLEKAVLDHMRVIANGEIPKDFVTLMTDVEYLQKVVYGNWSHRTWQDNKSRKMRVVAKCVLRILDQIHNKSFLG